MTKKTILLLVALLVAVLVLAIVYSYKYSAPKNSVNTVSPAPSEEVVEDEVSAGLVITTPAQNQVVSSPLKITGYVNGNDNWTAFEAQAGTARLYDNLGNLLVTGPLMATADWMTSTVPFEANLIFATAAPTGTLIFKNENPSGEPIRDRSVTFPVTF
ncbi:MAG: hypothetical protein KBC69_03370 [Candidatus Magasanikbacteria bacterium]|nr:hypothetical protein [Candidatus Magasanikbacteria bacterium]